MAEKKEKLKKVECDPDCGFMARSHDEKELVEIAIKHGKKFHNMSMSEDEVKKTLKAA